MLKLSIISALIAAPLVVAAIFLLPLPWFALVFAVLAGLGLFEWGRLVGATTGLAITGYLAGGAAIAALIWYWPSYWDVTVMVGAIWWLAGFLVVMRYPHSRAWMRHSAMAVSGYVVIVAAWMSLVVVRSVDGGSWLLVWLFVLVWGADIGAYFAGRAFGRRKLAREVSPGKTWEGVVGGLGLAMIACGGLAAVVPALTALGWGAAQWLMWILILGAISVFGDLFESALKRHNGVKDSGTMFPGHGGVLDRVDSVLAVLPFFALIVTFG